jgi:phosphatidylglycerophosphate synthase
VLAVAVVLAAAWHLKGVDFGLANQVTLLRTGLACLAAGALLAGSDGSYVGWSVAGVVALALSLDAVDGWLARRLGLASPFGARFDLEIDALMILILSLLVWQSGRAGIWVLAIGGMRYAFVALAMIWRPARQPLPPRWRRKAVCALIGVLLLLAILPPTPPGLAAAAAALALASQAVSFGIDLRWLGRLRGTASVKAA